VTPSPLRGISVAIAASLLLVGCATGQTSGAPSRAMTDVTIGVLPGVDLAPLYLGVTGGLFSDYGINLTINSLAGSSKDILQAVASRSFDFGYADTLSTLTALEEGAALEVLGAAATSTGTPRSDFAAIVVRDDSAIRSTADLDGATIGVEALGATSELVVRHAIDAADGDSDTVTWDVVTSVGAAQALDAGTVDAAFMVEPFVATAELDGFRTVAYPYAEFAPDLTVSAYVTSTSFAATDPDLVDRFQSALTASITQAQAAPTLARNSLGDYISTYSRVGTRLVLPRFMPAFSNDSVSKLATSAIDYGFLSGMPPLDQILPEG
jgi:NitT/TauT family transport system substrate-binding protein